MKLKYYKNEIFIQKDKKILLIIFAIKTKKLKTKYLINNMKPLGLV